MVGYWPTAPGNHPIVKEQMNSKPKLVFSKTLQKAEYESSCFATGAIAGEVARLKRSPGDGLLWVGGNALAASVLEQGLIDEVRLIVTPILLSGGKTVLGAIKARHPLRLVSTRSFNFGSVGVTYQPVLD